jgi:hypothetical protein
MAIIRCPECKKKVSDQAVSCVKCAYPISSPPVKDEPAAGYQPGNLCPHYGCGKKTPAGTHCGHCGGAIDPTSIICDGNIKEPRSIRYFWAKSNTAAAPSPPPPPQKPAQKSAVPWVTVGIAGRPLKPAQIKAEKREELKKQAKLLEDTLGEALQKLKK